MTPTPEQVQFVGLAALFLFSFILGIKQSRREAGEGAR